MLKFLRRWRPRHLLMAWSAYWLGLAFVTLGPAVPSFLRATRGDAEGSVNGAFGDGGLKLTIIESGTTIWEGSTSLLAFALLVIGPPILLWLLWLIVRPARPALVVATPADSRAALPEPTPDLMADRPPLGARQREPERSD